MNVPTRIDNDQADGTLPLRQETETGGSDDDLELSAAELDALFDGEEGGNANEGEGDNGDPEPKTPEADTRLDQIQQGLNVLAAAVIAQSQGRNEGAGEDKSEPELAAEDLEKQIREELTSEFPNLSDDLMNFMVKSQMKMSGRMVKGLQSQLDQVTKKQAENEGRAVLTDFETYLDGVLDELEVTDPFDRRTLKATVKQEGVEQYGNTFGKRQAKAMLTKLGNDAKRRTVTTNRQRTQRNQQDQHRHPRPPGQGRAGVEDVRKKMLQSNKPEHDFGGEFSQRFVANLAQQYEDAE